MSRRALHIRQNPPDEGVLVHVLGQAVHAQVTTARKRLGELGLMPDWAWAGQTDGWTLRFRSGESIVCSLVLAHEPLVAHAGVGASQLEAMKKGELLPASVLRHVEATSVHGTLRTVVFRLDNATGLSQLVALVKAKLAPKP